MLRPSLLGASVVLALLITATLAQDLALKSPLKSELAYQFFNIANNKFENPNSVLSREVSAPCKDDIRRILRSIQKYDEWALEFPDSWGRLPVGLLWGHAKSYGAYKECVAASYPLNTNLKGKYCLSSVPIATLMSQIVPRNATKARISYKYVTPSIFELGICVPNTCSASETNAMLKTMLREVYDITDQAYEKITMVSEKYCKAKKPIELRGIDIAFICFIAFIVFCMISSSIYDHMKTKSGEPKKPLFMAFSLLTNVPKVFTVKKTNNPNVINCLSGMRALSMMWVIYGHGYINYYALPHMNFDNIYPWLQTPYSILVQNATLCVDTFFFMSGLLVLWGAFREMDKAKGKLNIPLMYFHRYVRLTPVVAVVIFFTMSLYKYSGAGPMWMKIGTQDERCSDTWWATLLYVQNYVFPTRFCLSQTWYLAVDTQLYVLSPIVLIPLYKWGKKALAPVTLLLILCIGCMFAVFMVNDFTMFRVDDNNVDMRQAKTYYPTHTRLPSWLIGVLFGYFLYTKNRGKQMQLAKPWVILGWIVAFGTMIGCMWGPYWRRLPVSDPPAPIIEGALYEALSRPAWNIAMGWIIWACYNGHGSYINDFLSWDFFTALSRLSYSMYVLHRIVQYVNSGRIQTDTIFDDYDYILRWWSDFGMTLSAACFATMAFEVPILGIEKAIFDRGGEKPQAPSAPALAQVTQLPHITTELKQTDEKQTELNHTDEKQVDEKQAELTKV